MNTQRIIALAGLAALTIAAGPAGATSEPLECLDRSIEAQEVRTPEQAKVFVDCAWEFLQRNGEDEAYRAFHEDSAWRYGDTYIFVIEEKPSSLEATFFVHPVRPDVEGGTWGGILSDQFGTDFLAESARLVDVAGGAAFFYYAFTNPSTGLTEPKVSYIRRTLWRGVVSIIGAGVYLRDLPGSCNATDVSAAALATAPTKRMLAEFVRCASYRVEELGFFEAQDELESDPRWRDGSIYLFGMGLTGYPFLAGGFRFNGRELREFAPPGSPTDPFFGRDILSVVDTFGETFLYYPAVNPATGQRETKTSFVKRVSARGVPVLVGAGFYGSDQAADERDN